MELKRLLVSSFRYRLIICSVSNFITNKSFWYFFFQEVRNVFKVYGITVDPRHLNLVASFMTSGGGYRAFSRMGMGDCTSPLQQMSFETSIEFLKKATLQGLHIFRLLYSCCSLFNFISCFIHRYRQNGLPEIAFLPSHHGYPRLGGYRVI